MVPLTYFTKACFGESELGKSHIRMSKEFLSIICPTGDSTMTTLPLKHSAVTILHYRAYSEGGVSIYTSFNSLPHTFKTLPIYSSASSAASIIMHEWMKERDYICIFYERLRGKLSNDLRFYYNLKESENDVLTLSNGHLQAGTWLNTEGQLWLKSC